MFERFTDIARRIVVVAQEESRELRHDHIGTSHLVLALSREGDAPTTRGLLARHGVTHDALRAQVPAGPEGRTPSGHIPFSANAKAALEQAGYAADELGHQHVDQAHLLLGLLRIRAGRARALLGELGADLDELSVDAVRAARSGEAEAAASGGADPFADLIAEYRSMAAALGRFGRHLDGCAVAAGGETCDCGLSEALGRAVSVLGDEPPA